MDSRYVQYGCGLSAPEQWCNFDVSPTLRVQKIPVVGVLIKSKLNVTFPKNVRYGDITKGLPVPDESCKGLYCSHTLEHLSLNDLRVALNNSYKILQKGGIFRCVVPDLEFIAREYLKELEKGNEAASLDFVGPNTLLGVESRPRNLFQRFKSLVGNSHHLWMWDYLSLSRELKNAGFKDIRRCYFNDSSDNMFVYVESEDRFKNALGIECRK